MPDPRSLFARELRNWRVENGRRGPATQEQLAELMGVSVDAVGKWERSASFIRGDLEPRLARRLGWSRDQIIACRQDWRARQRGATDRGYRVLDDAVVDEVYDGSWLRACEASIELAGDALGDLPAELEANPEVFLPIYDSFRDHWRAIMQGRTMVAKWTLPFLLPEAEKQFLAGRLIEADLSLDRIHRPILPGTYFGYCPALVIRSGHEAAAPLLISTFVAFLEDLAARDILLHGLGTVTVRSGGAQLCRDLGMTRLCAHVLSREYGIWHLPGRAIPGSVFARRSPVLRRVYGEAFADDA